MHYRRKLTLLVCLLLVLLARSCHSAKPKQKGLIPGSAGPFAPNSSEQILVYFDVDRDGQIDILTKSISRADAKAYINVYIWNSLRKEYYASGSFAVDHYSDLKTAFVSSFNVAPQLILVTYFEDVLGSAKIVLQSITCSNYQCTVDKPMSIPQFTGSVDLPASKIDPIAPTLFTVEGEMVLVYHTQGAAKLLLFGANYTYNISRLQEKVNGSLMPSDFEQSYNGDYDGDCLADLILLTQSANSATFQFLKGDIYNSYTASNVYTLNQRVHHFTFEDINFDGKNDFVILLHSGDIQVHYNTNTNATLCRGVANPFDFQVSDTSPMQIQRVALGKKLYSGSVLLFGDYDNDGYEDLSLSFLDPTTSLPSATLLKNIQCVEIQCGTFNPAFIKQSLTLNLRTFTTVAIAGMSSVSTRMSFVDFFDDGNLDLIVESQLTDSNGKYIAIQPVYNTVDYDAFFIKMTILSRRTFQDPLSNSENVGGSASVYVTLLSGELAPRTANQMTQVGGKLQTPRVRFGLGRTNNYLETLMIKLPRKIEDPSFVQFTWSPIIPNSNLLIIPPPTTALQNVKGEWVLKMIIEPTEKMSLVAFLVVISLAVVGIMILHLSKKEKEEDKENQQSFYTLLR